jgi:hypothetical protein
MWTKAAGIDLFPLTWLMNPMWTKVHLHVGEREYYSTIFKIKQFYDDKRE